MTRRSIGRVTAALTLVVMALGVTMPAAASSFTSTQSCEVTVLSGQQSQQASRFGFWGVPLLGGLFGQHYNNLRDAVAAAHAGDTLLVQGTCTGVTEINKDLTLRGETTGFGLWGMQPESPGATLDGEQAGSVLTVDSGVHLTIDDVFITNGKSQFGGGIFSLGSVTLNNSRIGGNSAQFGGAIETVGGGALTLRNSVIDLNTAKNAGGAIVSVAGPLTLINSRIERNVAMSADGGAVFNGGGRVTLSESRINNNSAADGGGIFTSGGTVTLIASRIDHNSSATQEGGGIYNDNGTVTLVYSRVDRNSAYVGGGIFNSGGAVTLNGNSAIDHNTAVHDGGGIYNDSGTLTGASPGGNVYDNTPDDIAP